MIKKIICIVLLMNYLIHANAQLLKPGFDANEYKALLLLNFQASDSVKKSLGIPLETNYKKVYRSKEVGLLNLWELFINKDKKIAVISLRGTINKPVSWLENFYAATIPAEGSLQINDSTNFKYKLSENKNSVVHVGWTIGLAHLVPEIVEKVNELYKEGYRDFIIFGHSQGGALAFLTRSYLHYSDLIPRDIQFKTYASAAPKPGNLYYAYDFEFINSGGWAYRIVNTADWVPEVPFSVQGIKDFNDTNPFKNIKPVLQKQKPIVRWYLNGAYNKMDKSTVKAAKKFKKYLGDDMYKQVKKTLPQFVKPDYTASNNYTVAGNAIILQADSLYYKKFVFDGKNVFINHMLESYYYLTEKYYGNK